MAHHKSALKRIRTSEKSRISNRLYRKQMRNSLKEVLSSENKETAQPLLQKAESMLDRLAIKGIIHKNQAANKKSRLHRFVNKLS